MDTSSQLTSNDCTGIRHVTVTSNRLTDVITVTDWQSSDKMTNSLWRRRCWVWCRWRGSMVKRWGWPDYRQRLLTSRRWAIHCSTVNSSVTTIHLQITAFTSLCNVIIITSPASVPSAIAQTTALLSSANWLNNVNRKHQITSKCSMSTQSLLLLLQIITSWMDMISDDKLYSLCKYSHGATSSVQLCQVQLADSKPNQPRPPQQLIWLKNETKHLTFSEATTGYISPQQHSLLYQNKVSGHHCNRRICHKSDTKFQYLSHKE